MIIRKWVKILPYFIVEKFILKFSPNLNYFEINSNGKFLAEIYEFEEGVWLVRSVEWVKKMKLKRLKEELEALGDAE